MSDFATCGMGSLTAPSSSDDGPNPRLEAIRSQTSRLVAINARKLQHKSTDMPRQTQHDACQQSDQMPANLKSHKRPPEDRRARNRQSQSQYRERQKKQHLEQQQAVQILTKDVERLYAEISDLKRINASLQGSGSLDATTTVKEASQGDEGLTAKQAEFGCYNASLQSSGSMDAFTTVRDSPQSSAERPLDVPEALLLQRPWLPNADEDVVDSLCIMMSKACLSCELPQVSQQELRAAPILNILDNKEGVVEGFARHLQRIKNGQGAHALQELEVMMAAKIRMYRASMYTGFVGKDVNLNLAAERAYHQAVLQRGPLPANHWQLVAARIEFTPAQQCLLGQMHDQLQQQMQKCRSEHRRLLAALQDGLPTEPDGDAFASRYLVGMEYSDQLRKNMKAEHEAITIFCLRVREEVLTSYQHAVMEVASFPWRVDLPAICAVIDCKQASLPVTSMLSSSSPSGPPRPTYSYSAPPQSQAAPPLQHSHAVLTSGLTMPSTYAEQESVHMPLAPATPFLSDVFQLDELDIPTDPFQIIVEFDDNSAKPHMQSLYSARQ